jgi:hypothetical protein
MRAASHAKHKERLNAKSRDNYYKRRDQRLTTAKEYRSRPDVVEAQRNASRLRKTGWTPAMFETAWTEQKGLCAVCGSIMLPAGFKRDSVQADHDHATGRPRALLHARCNLLLGMAIDSPQVLEAAANYLRKHGKGST